MTILNRKISPWTAAAVCLLAIGIAFVATRVAAQPSTVAFQATASATTTVAYLAPGMATSTYQIDDTVFSSGKVANMQQIDSLALYVQFAPSSTISTLVITPQYSNNNLDWYGYNQIVGTIGGTVGSTTGAATLNATYNGSINLIASSSASIYWTPGTTATSSTAFLLPLLPTQHMRVRFTNLSASGAVYAEIDLKKNPSTP